MRASARLHLSACRARGLQSSGSHVSLTGGAPGACSPPPGPVALPLGGPASRPHSVGYALATLVLGVARLVRDAGRVVFASGCSITPRADPTPPSTAPPKHIMNNTTPPLKLPPTNGTKHIEKRLQMGSAPAGCEIAPVVLGNYKRFS